MEKLYTRKEAAEMLGISISTLDSAKGSGAIAFVQYVPNGSVFFSEEALQEYIARNTHRATPPDQRSVRRRKKSNT